MVIISEVDKAGQMSSVPRDRKNGLSCAECRRSKLKCDRVFPCQSCIRRGCAQLCPDGILVATKGNKVLLGHVQRLSDQVRFMSTRIRELEHSLSQQPAKAGSGWSLSPFLGDAHISTDSDTVWDPSMLEASEAFGTLSLGKDGQARYYGHSAGSEYFHDLLAEIEGSLPPSKLESLGLPTHIIDLINSFPFGQEDCPYTKDIFVPFLPTQERAMELVDLYYRNAAWMYNPISAIDFLENVMIPIYESPEHPNLDNLHAHRISVFFTLLATGVLYDNQVSSSIPGEQFYALACAAFSLSPVSIQVTSATTQALFMIIRHIYSTDRTKNETRWLLTGMCVRIAQTVGLRRESAGWGLPADEVQRRRIMFWELFTYDAWSSVITGRPPAMDVRHADCHFPDGPESSTNQLEATQRAFHAWKFRYSATCLPISAQLIFSTKRPDYAEILDLDKRIRNFPVPPELQSPASTLDKDRSWSMDPARAMQQYCIVCARESNLLYIHRRYFTQAIREDSTNPSRHAYAPSVLAAFSSACRIISSLKDVYSIHPALSSRTWFFWSGAFSSCVILGTMIVESPGCILSQNALQELEQAVAFYDEGSAPCRPPATLTVLRNLLERAQSMFTAHCNRVVDSETGKPPRNSNTLDELDILGGRKTLIVGRAASIIPPSQMSSPLLDSCSGRGRESLSEHSSEVHEFTSREAGDHEMADTQWKTSRGGEPNTEYPAQLWINELGHRGLHNSPTNPNSSPAGSSRVRYPAPPAQYSDDTLTTLEFPMQPRCGVRPSHLLQPESDYPSVASRQPGSVSARQQLGNDMLSFPIDHEPNQEEIWRTFIGNLGLQSHC